MYLVKEDKKNDVIAEACDAVGGRHGNQEGEHVVNEGVEELVE